MIESMQERIENLETKMASQTKKLSKLRLRMKIIKKSTPHKDSLKQKKVKKDAESESEEE